jgi:hypothetical protein
VGHLSSPSSYLPHWKNVPENRCVMYWMAGRKMEAVGSWQKGSNYREEKGRLIQRGNEPANSFIVSICLFVLSQASQSIFLYPNVLFPLPSFFFCAHGVDLCPSRAVCFCPNFGYKFTHHTSHKFGTFSLSGSLLVNIPGRGDIFRTRSLKGQINSSLDPNPSHK